MRYVGQGHEIDVPVPTRALTASDGAALFAAYEERYAKLYGRAIPNMDVEILTWAVTVSAPAAQVARASDPAPAPAPKPAGRRRVFEPSREALLDLPVYARDQLAPGVRIAGPCLVTEAQTTTIVSPAFDLRVDGLANLVLERKQES
jgi:N-methylhydantoinase A